MWLFLSLWFNQTVLSDNVHQLLQHQLKGKNTEQWRSNDIVNQTCISQLDADLRNGRLLTSGLQNMFWFSFFWCRLPVNKITIVQRKHAVNITTMLIVAVELCSLFLCHLWSPKSKEVSWSKDSWNCALCHYPSKIIYIHSCGQPVK